MPASPLPFRCFHALFLNLLGMIALIGILCPPAAAQLPPRQRPALGGFGHPLPPTRGGPVDLQPNNSVVPPTITAQAYAGESLYGHWVSLTWPVPADGSGTARGNYYIVERETGTSGDWAKIGASTDFNQGLVSWGLFVFDDFALPPSTTYGYRLRLYQASDGSISGPSAVTFATTLRPTPLTPTNVVATPGNGSITLSWVGSPLADYYTVEEYASNSTKSDEDNSPDDYFVVPQPSKGFSPTLTIPNLTNGVNYLFLITARTNDYMVFSRDAYAQATPVPQSRIDAGSSAAYADANGHVWTADQNTTGGTTSTAAPIAGTGDPALYQTQRAGTSFTYTIPIANDSYTLSLLFAETQNQQPGQRTFTVKAGSQTLLSSFDIAAAAGQNTALIKSFTVPVTNGQLVLTFTGNVGSATLAALQLVPHPTTGGIIYSPPGGSQPAPDIPPPGWAEDVLPTDDSSDADGMGPSMAGPVNTASGVEENSPGADIWTYNPIGPSASYSRMYRSARALQGYASPGMSPGWVDNYDQSITITGSAYTRVYPNGAQEAWTGTTGALTPPAGAPYTAVQTPSMNSRPAFITVTEKDRSKEIFTQMAQAGGNYPAGTYLLTQVTNLVGHSLFINRDASASGYRVLNITDDAPTPQTLLIFSYTPFIPVAKLSFIREINNGRQVNYDFRQYIDTTPELNSVSQIGGFFDSPRPRWAYGYTPSPTNGQPLLTQVSVPNPANPAPYVYATAYTTYYDTGAVAEHIDATGRVKSYSYNGSQTQIQANNADGSVAQTWTQKQNITSKNQDAGVVDAKNKATSISYTGTPSPYLPSAETNRNGQKASVTYDTTNNYGNVATVLSPRNVQVATTYQYPADFPLGQPITVQQSHLNVAGTAADDTQQPTSFSYYGPTDIPTDGGPAGTLNGLLATVSSPQPDSTTASPGYPVTTAYSYDSLGNVTRMATPNANGTMTVTYNYTTDGTFSQAEALGEPLSVTVSGPDAYGNTTTATTHYRYDQRGNRIAVIDPSGYETDFAYNIADQLTDTLYPATGDSGPGRAKTTVAYQYPGGPESSTTVYDESGSVFRQVSPVYDAEGEVLTVQGSTYPVQYVYDGRGRVKSVTYYGQSIMNASTTYYDYDAVGNLADIRYPGATGANYDQKLYSYDADNNLIKEVDGIGLEKDYLRADPESLMTGIHYVYPSNYTGTVIGDEAYTYDHYGRRASLIDRAAPNPSGNANNQDSSKTYSYDDLDELTSLTTNFGSDYASSRQTLTGQTLSFQHNPDGSRSALDTSNDYQLYSYDGLGRLTFTSLYYTHFGAGYTYQPNGWMTQRQVFGFPPNVNQYQPYLQTDTTYNPRGLVATLTNSILANAAFGTSAQMLSAFTGSNPASTGPPRMTYDPVGNRLQESATVPAHGKAPDLSRQVSYRYDGLDQLTQETSQAAAGTTALNYTNTFGYDLSGNPTTSNRLKGTSFNTDNQFTSVLLNNNTSKAVTYNGNGDPLGLLSYYGTSFSTAFITYDPEDRLTQADQGNLRVTYDGDGLRNWNYYGFTGGIGSYYLFDGSSSVTETDSSGTQTAFSLYGADGLTARVSAADGYVAETYDPQGNLVQPVVLYLNQAGTADTVHIAASSAFDAFGGSRTYTADGQGFSSASYDPVAFGGQFGYYKDLNGRYLLGHRYYDSFTGRFLTRDPIGYKGGINLCGSRVWQSRMKRREGHTT